MSPNSPNRDEGGGVFLPVLLQGEHVKYFLGDVRENEIFEGQIGHDSDLGRCWRRRGHRGERRKTQRLQAVEKGKRAGEGGNGDMWRFQHSTMLWARTEENTEKVPIQSSLSHELGRKQSERTREGCEQRDEQVAPYFSLYFWLFWTIVLRSDKRSRERARCQALTSE